MNIIKCVVFICTVLLITGICGACNGNIEPMPPEMSNAVLFDFIGGEDVMPIAGYFGPYYEEHDDGTYLDYITDECWKAISECGINLISFAPVDYTEYPDKVIENLEFAEKYNISLIVTDMDIEKLALNEVVTEDDILSRLTELSEYPAFGGIFLIDEPCTDYFLPEGEMESWRYLDYWSSLAPVINQEVGLFTYTNAYPSCDSGAEYERYLNDFADALQPQYIQFDRYPFYSDKDAGACEYFRDLAIVRKVAQERGLAFWAFIQAGGQWNDAGVPFDSYTPYYPTEGQMDWSINTALAFGAQGIDIFPLIQPYGYADAVSQEHDFERNGIIGASGEKNQWFYYLQSISKQIKAVDEVLMKSVNKGVLAVCDAAQAELAQAKEYGAVLDGCSWRELEAVSGNVLIGCFNFDGKTALYVVNYSTSSEQSIELSFKKKAKMTVTQNGVSHDTNTDILELDLTAGEGVLVVIN